MTKISFTKTVMFMICPLAVLFCSCQNARLVDPSQAFDPSAIPQQAPTTQPAFTKQQEAAQLQTAHGQAALQQHLAKANEKRPAARSAAMAQATLKLQALAEKNKQRKAEEAAKGSETNSAISSTGNVKQAVAQTAENAQPKAKPASAAVAAIAYPQTGFTPVVEQSIQSQPQVENCPPTTDQWQTCPPGAEFCPPGAQTCPPGAEFCPAPSAEYCPPVEMGQPAILAPMEFAPQPQYFRELPVMKTRRMDDEYVCDGGDRNTKITIGENFEISGLDIEDTAAHFDTLDGKRVVSPSNKVCIYAPRFASVRKTYGIAWKNRSAKIAGIEEKVNLQQARDNVASNTTMQQVQPTGQIGSKIANSLLEQQRANEFDRTQKVYGFHNLFAAHEDFQIIKLGRYDNAEKARLASAMQSAEVWATDLGVQVLVKADFARITRGQKKPQEVFTHEDPDGRPNVRVIKVADKKDANSGEIVEFTIRFDNFSNEPIGNVTVLDNLSPRLEYVKDSQQCSLEADFIPMENEKESTLLRWEIRNPIEPGKGGIVRFKCLVR